MRYIFILLVLSSCRPTYERCRWTSLDQIHAPSSKVATGLAATAEATRQSVLCISRSTPSSSLRTRRWWKRNLEFVAAIVTREDSSKQVFPRTSLISSTLLISFIDQQNLLHSLYRMISGAHFRMQHLPKLCSPSWGLHPRIQHSSWFMTSIQSLQSRSTCSLSISHRRSKSRNNAFTTTRDPSHSTRNSCRTIQRSLSPHDSGAEGKEQDEVERSSGKRHLQNTPTLRTVSER